MIDATCTINSATSKNWIDRMESMGVNLVLGENFVLGALAVSGVQPNVGVGPDGEVMLTWDSPEHHLELEIFPEGTGEFFYLNRKTDEAEEWEYTIGWAIPEEVIEKLKLFWQIDILPHSSAVGGRLLGSETQQVANN